VHLGYGTNGFAHHRLDDALAIIADLGYTGVSLTLDHHHLDPYAEDFGAQVDRLAVRLDQFGLRVVVETSAPYLLDPRHEHSPTLVGDRHTVRVGYLVRAAQIAAGLGADCVSFRSGDKPAAMPHEVARSRLRSAVAEVLDGAACHDVRFGLEPTAGALVRNLDDALRLRAELGDPDRLGIALSVGHRVDPVAEIRRAGDRLFTVRLADAPAGVGGHTEFGVGSMDLMATLDALDEIGYVGVAAVDLPDHSHAAPVVATRAMRALRQARACDPWLEAAEQAVRADASAIRTLFSAVSRGIPDGGRHDLARVRLLVALAESSPDLGREVRALYDYGGPGERRGVLRGLNRIGHRIPEVGAAIIQDAHRA